MASTSTSIPLKPRVQPFIESASLTAESKRMHSLEGLSRAENGMGLWIGLTPKNEVLAIQELAHQAIDGSRPRLQAGPGRLATQPLVS
jgi:hypothetical protein